MNRFGSLLLLLIMLPLGLYAQKPDTPAALTMDQALQIALANNRQIRKAVLDVESSDQQIRQAWGNVMPQINSSVSYVRNVEIPVTFIPEVIFNPQGDPNNLIPAEFGTDNNWQGGFSVQQVIFQGQAFVGISSAELVQSLRNEQLRAVTQQVLTQTRAYYLNVLIARQQLELRKESLKRIKKNLEENRARYEEGLIDEYSVMQLEVQLESQQPMVDQAQYQLNDAYRQLKNHLGVDDRFDFTVKGNLSEYRIHEENDNPGNRQLQKISRMVDVSEYLAMQDEKDPVPEPLLRNRADFQLNQFQTDLKEKEIKSIKSNFLPSVVANYNLNWNAAEPGSPNFFGDEQQRARSQTLMFNVSLPLFTGFQRHANLRQAQIDKKQLALDREQVKNDASSQIKSLLDRLDQLKKMYDGQQKAVETAREGYRIAREQYRNGVGSQLDVTNAELALRQAKLSFSQTIFNYLNTKAQLDAAIGQVPLVDVNQPEKSSDR